MFDSQYFNSNKQLLDECMKLVDQHNKLSYQKLKLLVPTIEYKFISKKKPQDSVSKDITSFYETYTKFRVVVNQLSTLLESMNYTTDDLVIHIDLSTDSILNILAGLTETRERMIEYQSRITQNCELSVDAFAKHVKDQTSESSNIDDIIETIFTCIKQQGIGVKANINEETYLFMPVGSSLLITLHELLSPEQIQRVKIKIDSVKQMLLHTKPNTVLPVNRLQRFALLPDEGTNIDFKTAIQTLLGIDIPHADSFQKMVEPLSNVLKLSETGQPVGVLVVVSKNDDNYFDMSTILLMNQSQGSSGINESMVQTYDLIKEGKSANVKADELISINVKPDRAQVAYMVWTNNLKTFKIRKAPIRQPMINKVLRQSPSPIVEAYNATFERIIAESRKEDIVSFNRVKYMSFSNDITEEQYLDDLHAELVKAISHAIVKLQSSKLKDTVIEKSFSDMILSTIDAAKLRLGIHAQMLPSHSHIIYASMADSILKRIKKSLVVLDRVDKKMIYDIVKLHVKTNDNIYSRVVASYYLHMA